MQAGKRLSDFDPLWLLGPAAKTTACHPVACPYVFPADPADISWLSFNGQWKVYKADADVFNHVLLQNLLPSLV